MCVSYKSQVKGWAFLKTLPGYENELKSSPHLHANMSGLVFGGYGSEHIWLVQLIKMSSKKKDLDVDQE